MSNTDEKYLIEWLQDFGSAKGLSVSVSHSNLRVYTGAPDWANAFPVAPSTSYHATVVKKPGELRVYMNGTLMYTDSHPNFGVPKSEIVIGGSTWRGAGVYGDYLAAGTSITGVALWQGAMTDAQVAALRGPTATLEDPTPELSIRPAYEFRLGGFRPNPATHEMNVVFTLPSANAATLELIDVGGRRVGLARGRLARTGRPHREPRQRSQRSGRHRLLAEADPAAAGADDEGRGGAPNTGQAGRGSTLGPHRPLTGKPKSGYPGREAARSTGARSKADPPGPPFASHGADRAVAG